MDWHKNLLKKVMKWQLLFRSLYLFPSYVQIEPTTKCNLRCKMCLRSQVEQKVDEDMNFNLFKSIINQLRGSFYITRMVNLTGLGESLLNPNIISMVKYAKNSGLRVQIVTNLTEVDENTLEGLIKAKLDVLAVSFDGATKETFEKIRVGAVFEEVVENIKLLLRLKREMEVGKPKVYLNSTVCEENVREIPAMIKMAEDLGVNGIVFMKQAVPGTKYWDSNVFSLLANEKFHSEKIEVIGCLDMKSMCCVARTCYITFDGKVLPCYPIYELISRDEYKHYEMGDLTRQRFSEIWFSRRYRQLRTSKVFGMPLPFCYSCFANK